MIQVGSPAYIIVSGNWKRVIELANQLKERPDTVKQFETLGWFLIGELSRNVALDDRRCFYFSMSISFTQAANPGEGKLEELLEEMPTGQEDLTRERKDRLKEVLSL